MEISAARSFKYFLSLPGEKTKSFGHDLRAEWVRGIFGCGYAAL